MSLDPNRLYESSGIKQSQDRVKKYAQAKAKKIAQQQVRKAAAKIMKRRVMRGVAKGIGKNIGRALFTVIKKLLVKVLMTIVTSVLNLFLTIGWPIVVFFIIVLVLCFLGGDYNFDGQADTDIKAQYEKVSMETIDASKPEQVEWKVPTGLISAFCQIYQLKNSMSTSMEAVPNFGGDPNATVSGGADAVVKGAIEWEQKHAVVYAFGGPGMEEGKADCSQFTQYIFSKYASIDIGRTTGAQLQTPGGKRVSIDQLMPGDLVFFKNTYKNSYKEGVSHVGIYIGNGEIIENSAGKPSGIKRMTLTKFIHELNSIDGQNHWLTGLRVFPDISKVVVPPIPKGDPTSPPPQYMPIYKAAEKRFGVPWYLLAAIHFQETTFSTDKQMVSSAGALGPMQIMPANWIGWKFASDNIGHVRPGTDLTNLATIRAGGGIGIDGDGDGKADPMNVWDSVFSSANYLAQEGARTNIQKAIYAYNHDNSYVNSVLAHAYQFAKINTSNVQIPVGVPTSVPVGNAPTQGDPSQQLITYADLARQVVKGLEPHFTYKTYTVNKWEKVVTMAATKGGGTSKSESAPTIIGKVSKDMIVKAETWRGTYVIDYTPVPGKWVLVRVEPGQGYVNYIYDMVEDLKVKSMVYTPDYSRLKAKFTELGFYKHDIQLFQLMFNSQVNELSKEVTNRQQIKISFDNQDNVQITTGANTGDFSSVGQTTYPDKIPPSGYAWPVPTIHTITSPFGMRWGRLHRGVDIANGSAGGTPIYAAADGVVLLAGATDPTGFGQAIYIDHGNGVFTRYGHLQWNAYGVKSGEHVKKGQYIGEIGHGNVGDARGEHLHFEIIIDGHADSGGNITGTWVNPLQYVRP